MAQAWSGLWSGLCRFNQSPIEIYQQFFTESWHGTRRIHRQKSGSYQDHKIVDSEYVSKNRIYLYTEDDLNSQRRFLFIRQADNSWLLDKMQIKFGYKWESYTP